MVSPKKRGSVPKVDAVPSENQLSEREVRAAKVLWAREMTAKRLASRTGMTKVATYALLRRLTSRGFVFSSTPGRDGKTGPEAEWFRLVRFPAWAEHLFKP